MAAHHDRCPWWHESAVAVTARPLHHLDRLQLDKLLGRELHRLAIGIISLCAALFRVNLAQSCYNAGVVIRKVNTQKEFYNPSQGAVNSCKPLSLLHFSLAPFAHAQNLEVILRNGTVIDGSGSLPVHTDVGISGDRIVFVGSGAGRNAKRVIDATGLVITPGFIDPHTHTAVDLTDAKRRQNTPYLMQGVTTVATGNDGESPEHIGETLATWTRQGIGTNAVLFIGQGTVRREVMEMSDARPTPEQMEKMKALVDSAMNEADRLSTGALRLLPAATRRQKKSSSWPA